MRTSNAVALFFLLAPGAMPQARPDVKEILAHVSQTYAVSSYEFFATARAKNAGAAKSAPDLVHLAFQGNRYRMEGALPGMAAEEPGLGAGVIVYDGSAIWMYLHKTNQYVSIPASELTADAPGDLGDMRPEAMDTFMMWRYRGATKFSESTLLREEAIAFAGAKADCYVLKVSVTGRSTYTWWVDKKRYLVLREDNAESSTVYTAIKLNQALPEELFQFTPPAGAQKIEPDK